MKSISPMELKAMMDSGNEFQLIDIRDDYEYNICCIGGEKINMYSIFDNIDKISRNNKVIIYCRTGVRSGNIAKFLEESFSFDNVYNLDGGIMRWRDDVDSSLVSYQYMKKYIIMYYKSDEFFGNLIHSKESITSYLLELKELKSSYKELKKLCINEIN